MVLHYIFARLFSLGELNGLVVYYRLGAVTGF